MSLTTDFTPNLTGKKNVMIDPTTGEIGIATPSTGGSVTVNTVAPVAGNITLEAVNGLSVNSSKFVLGNDLNSTLAVLTSDREIPTDGKTINLTGTGKLGILRNAGQKAQASLHIGNSNTAGNVGTNTILLTNNLNTTKNVGNNTITNGTSGTITNESEGSVILNGENISVINTAGVVTNDCKNSTVGSADKVDLEAANKGVVFGVKYDSGSFLNVASEINNTLSGKWTSGLLCTTNAFIGSDLQNYWNNGDNNMIIGGHDNAIGYNLNLTSPGVGNWKIAPTLNANLSTRYVDDSVIIGSQFSEITDAGNVVIISGQANKSKGMVRSSIIASDEANIVATTRNVSGGQVSVISSKLASVKDVSYTVTVATENASVDGSIGSNKDRSAAIAGNGLRIGISDQLVTGTYNEGLATNSFEVGMGLNDGSRLNAFAIQKDGVILPAKLTTAPPAVLGGLYFNSASNTFFKCTTAGTWVAF